MKLSKFQLIISIYWDQETIFLQFKLIAKMWRLNPENFALGTIIYRTFEELAAVVLHTEK